MKRAVVIIVLALVMTGCSVESPSDTEERLRGERDALQEELREVRNERDNLQDRTAFWERQAAIVAACDALPTCLPEWVADQRAKLGQSPVEWHGEGSAWFWGMIAVQLAAMGIPLVLLGILTMYLYLRVISPKSNAVAKAKASVAEADQRTADAHRKLLRIKTDLKSSRKTLGKLQEQIHEAQDNLASVQEEEARTRRVVDALRGFN